MRCDPAINTRPDPAQWRPRHQPAKPRQPRQAAQNRNPSVKTCQPGAVRQPQMHLAIELLQSERSRSRHLRIVIIDKAQAAMSVPRLKARPRPLTKRAVPVEINVEFSLASHSQPKRNGRSNPNFIIHSAAECVTNASACGNGKKGRRPLDQRTNGCR